MADFGNAFSMAMKAGAGLIDAEIKKENQIEAEQRAADLKLQMEERLSAIREASDARASERREQIRLSGRKSDFDFDTNPENVKAKATAETTAMETTAPVKARLEREASKEKLLSESTPEALAAKRKIAQAGHIESSSAIAAANLSKFQLDQLKEAAALQDDYQAAIDAGDDVAAAKIERKIAAGKQTNKKDAGDYLRAATQLYKEAPNADTPQEAAEMKATAKLMMRLAGVDPAKAIGEATGAAQPPAAALDYLKKNPASIEDFKKKYPGYDTSSIASPPATEKPKRGIIDSAPVISDPNAPSYEKWVAAKRRLEEIKNQAKNMSPDRREAYLANRAPDIEAEIEFHSKYKTF